MTRTLLVSLLTVASVSGCGGGQPAVNDLAMSSAGDMATVDQLDIGIFNILGITSDGFIAYIDAGHSLFVLPVTGGTPLRVDGKITAAFVDGKAVFAWHDSLDAMGNGPLAVWTNANGTKEVATAAATEQGASSTDGSLIAWFDNVNTKAGTADLVIDKADHSAEKVLVKMVGLTVAGCTPSIGFVGTRLVASHCTAAAPPSVTITSYDLTGASVDLVTGAANRWASDVAGTAVLAQTIANVAAIYPAAGGAPLVSGLDNFQSGEFTSDGSAAVYSTTTNGLFRVSVKSALSVSLQANGVDDFIALSPDGNSVLFYSQIDNSTHLTDLFLASATKAGASTSLALTPTAATGGIFGSPFSADSTQALYFTAVDPVNIVGTFTARATTGGAPHTFGTVAMNAASVTAAGASKVVFLGNFVPAQAGGGVGDLYALDLAGAGTPVLMATQVDVSFAVTPDNRSVVVSYYADMSRAGLYLAEIP